MCAWQKFEHSVGLEVAVRVIGVVIEGETWLSGTGGIGGFGGCDVVLSGPTEGEDWDQQYQQVDTHSHRCRKKNNCYLSAVCNATLNLL